ncbi:MAG: hypothetical protein RL757_2108 [Bacteroidota bacterium]|jgi:hypothetical protein
MKKLLIVNVLIFLSSFASAQQTTKKPTPSPEAAFTQQFGGSEIQVAYARPLARGRKIFGGLVPFDSLWRTGAGDCTILTLKEDVIIGGKKLGAGKYSLFSIPTANDWTIVLNSDVSLHGTGGYDTQKDVHRFPAKSMKTDRFYETFTIEINDMMPNGDASLNLIWENTLVKIPLQSPLYMAVQTPNIENMPKMAENTGGGGKVETQTKTDAHAGHDMSKMDKNTEGAKTVDLKTQFAPVLSAYYALKDALVADNAKLAAEKGKAMKTALRSIETKNWTAKQRNAYDEVAKKLDTDAAHIGDNAGKIDHQREHFMSLSNNLTSLVKTLKINEETAYSQFCPMANDGKGAYWLSKEDKVKNPYYGKKMLTCGSVKETLK